MTVRLRDLALVVLSIAVEALLFIGLWSAAPVLGSVSFAHLGTWIHTTDPTTALLSVLRLVGMLFAAWLLVTTVVYLAATIAGAESVAHRSGWVTLPLVRHMIDGLAAAAVLTSALHSSGGLSDQAPAAIVQPLSPPQPVNHRQIAGADISPIAPPLAARPAAPTRHIPHPGVVHHTVLTASRMPALSAAADAPSPANGFEGLSPGTKVVVVKPGDCLSIIAEQHLGGNWQTGDEKSTPSMSGASNPTAEPSPTTIGSTPAGS